jgi:5'-nucleotidase
VRILVTNDDGIHADGLLALADALSAVAQVTIIAPEREHSAGGHAITLHKPLRITRVNINHTSAEAYSTNGTPADCVVLGVLDVMGGLPDWVVAGINRGPNLGEDLMYSGTVSAAMEAAVMGVPAFAISVADYEATDFDVAARFAADLTQRLAPGALPPESFLNVNVPNLPAEQLRGVRVTTLGRRKYKGRLEKRLDPRGRIYYWLGGDPTVTDPAEATDAGAVASGFISITPLHFDLTNHALIAEMAALLE